MLIMFDSVDALSGCRLGPRVGVAGCKKAACEARRPVPEARGIARGSRGSALRELLATSRLVEADLLALDLARVARDEARARQRRLERRVVVDQCTGDAVAHRARLAGLAAAGDVDHDVEAADVVGELERLAHDHATGLAREVVVERLAVDYELAGAAHEE